MGSIASVGQKDLNSPIFRRMNAVQPGFGNFGSVVAKTGHLGIELFKIHRAQLLIHKKGHIGTPLKAHESRIFPNSVMVSGNDNHLDSGNGGKQIIDLLQIPQQGLAVEEIAGNKQKINIPDFCLANDFTKSIMDGVGPFPAPGLIAVGMHSPVNISCVDEFHREISFAL